MHGHNNQPFVIALVSHTLWIPKVRNFQDPTSDWIWTTPPSP
jgi:hypothetical protein